ncbi:unnamed protein product [Brassicogethes aeneus]|uniref:Exonuclease domain-containing protein n=1 Tax=Brassicogethes aeneus TaxID=1431903 RepID=A0A9P0FAY9_BRAAE|nr:unnamed protein product [Brassicogethes aeneus]
MPVFDNNREIDFEIVFFDLETGGFAYEDDILQIGLRYQEKWEGIYVTPTKRISPSASEVHNLTNIGEELFFHGIQIPSVPLQAALKKTLDFLLTTNKPCVLVAHNVNFDSTRLINALLKTGQIEEFSKIIFGFVDTLPLFRNMLNRQNNCSLGFLAKEANIKACGAHDALADVLILQKLIKHHQISDEQLLSQVSQFNYEVSKQIAKNHARMILKTLSPLEGTVSEGMMNKMAAAGIDFPTIIDTYITLGEDGIYMLFTELVTEKPRVTKSRRIINSVTSFLQNIIT